MKDPFCWNKKPFWKKKSGAGGLDDLKRSLPRWTIIYQLFAPNITVVHLPFSSWMKSPLSSHSEVRGCCGRGSGSSFLASQNFQRETAASFLRVLSPGWIYPCCTETEPSCPVQVECGRWNPQSVNEVAGQDTHAPTHTAAAPAGPRQQPQHLKETSSLQRWAHSAAQRFKKVF